MNIHRIDNEYTPLPEIIPSSSTKRLTLPTVELQLPAQAHSDHLEDCLSDVGISVSGYFTAYDMWDCFGTCEEKSITDYVDALMLKHNMFAWSIQFTRCTCYIDYYKGYPPKGFSVDLPPHTRRTWNVGGTICTLRSS